MDLRVIKVFIATFLIAAVALFGAWLLVDGIAHLDEFLAASGPDAPLARVAVRYYSGVIRLHGGTLLGAVTVAAAASGLIRVRRGIAGRSGTMA